MKTNQLPDASVPYTTADGFTPKHWWKGQRGRDVCGACRDPWPCAGVRDLAERQRAATSGITDPAERSRVIVAIAHEDAEREARKAAPRPAPKVGDRVTPREGVEHCGHPVPATEHVVVAVHDYRPGLDLVEVVVHEASTYHYIASLEPALKLGPEYGLHLGLDDIVERS